MKRSLSSSRKRIIIIAGPNGAGKTTFAKVYLSGLLGSVDFINADLIARGLSPKDPPKAAIQAGKVMLEQISQKVQLGETFALETTLSGRSYARRIPQWRKLGYQVILVFLSLPTTEAAIARVKLRVSQGGHDIAENVIRRRFSLGIENFQKLYRGLVDDWVLYDNSVTPPLLIEKGENRES